MLGRNPNHGWFSGGFGPWLMVGEASGVEQMDSWILPSTKNGHLEVFMNFLALT